MASILDTAQTYCDTHNVRFTDTRREVLKIISLSETPITAYEILDQLKNTVKNPKPPIVYRATDFWQEHGFVHKIESINAFVTCGENHRHKGSQFMICDTCGQTTEMHSCSLPPKFKDHVAEAGFQPVSWNVEVHGVCRDCQG